MEQFGKSHKLTHNNRFKEATKVLSDALSQWKSKNFGESDLPLIQPMMTLAELYRTQGLEKVSQIINYSCLIFRKLTQFTRILIW
jgi:hypothetical protein